MRTAFYVVMLVAAVGSGALNVATGEFMTAVWALTCAVWIGYGWISDVHVDLLKAGR